MLNLSLFFKMKNLLFFFLLFLLFLRLTFNVINRNTSDCTPCLVAFSTISRRLYGSVFFDSEPIPAQYFNGNCDVSSIIWYCVECTLTDEWQIRRCYYWLCNTVYFVLYFKARCKCAIIKETN